MAQSEYDYNIKVLQSFFENRNRGAFLFAVSDNEALQKKISKDIRHLNQGKGEQLLFFSWLQDVEEGVHPIHTLQQRLKEETYTGIIFFDLSLAAEKDENLLVQINYAREELMGIGVPILFWVRHDGLVLLNRRAQDVYNQRQGSNIYFEKNTETQDDLRQNAHYIVEQTIDNNPDLERYKSKIKILHRQLQQAEEQGRPKDEIANEIVAPLLALYAELPLQDYITIELLKAYEPYFDLSNDVILSNVAWAILSIGDLTRAEKLYLKALEVVKNRQIGREEEATLNNNLGVVYSRQGKYAVAEEYYERALQIRLKLAEKEPFKFIDKLASALNNIAAVQHEQKNYLDALKHYEDAISLYRKLAGDENNEWDNNLAKSLLNASGLYRTNGEYNKALEVLQEALDILNELHEENPQHYQESISNTKWNLATVYADLGDLDMAEDLFLQVEKIYRNLAEKKPEYYLPALIGAKLNLATFYRISKVDKAFSFTYINSALSILHKIENSLILKQKLESIILQIKHWDLDPATYLAEQGISLPKGLEIEE